MSSTDPRPSMECPVCRSPLRGKDLPATTFGYEGSVEGNYECPNGHRLLFTGGNTVTAYPDDPTE